MSNFRVGQKVVAIPRPEFVKRVDAGIASPVHIGKTYTIRDIDRRAMSVAGHGIATLRFEEIINPSVHTCLGPWEIGYDPRCFRPVVERKTDISIFTKMLDGSRVLETTVSTRY